MASTGGSDDTFLFPDSESWLGPDHLSFPLARGYDSELAIIDTLFPFHGPSGPFLLYLEARTGH
jgi:hypothetical protein